MICECVGQCERRRWQFLGAICKHSEQVSGADEQQGQAWCYEVDQNNGAVTDALLSMNMEGLVQR